MAAQHGTQRHAYPNFERVHELIFDGAIGEMEQMILGLVAHRAGQKLQYDPAVGRITNAGEAIEYLGRKYRPGWTLNG